MQGPKAAFDSASTRDRQECGLSDTRSAFDHEELPTPGCGVGQHPVYRAQFPITLYQQGSHRS
jgi:hypothetical protein